MNGMEVLLKIKIVILLYLQFLLLNIRHLDFYLMKRES